MTFISGSRRTDKNICSRACAQMGKTFIEDRFQLIPLVCLSNGMTPYLNRQRSHWASGKKNSTARTAATAPDANNTYRYLFANIIFAYEMNERKVKIQKFHIIIFNSYINNQTSTYWIKFRIIRMENRKWMLVLVSTTLFVISRTDTYVRERKKLYKTENK